MGCGVACFDFDNDGWLDLFVLSGTRLEGAAGFDQSSLQEQPRRHLHRCHGEGGPDAIGLGIGGHRRRLRQRRLRRSLHHLLRSERPLPQQRRRHVHRRDREGGPAAGRCALRLGLHMGRLRSRRPSRSLRRDVPEHDAREAAEARREHRLPLEGRAGELRSSRAAARIRPALSQQRRRHVHRRQPAIGRRGAPRARTR